MSKGVLYDYTRGGDGLYRKVSHFGNKTVEHVRDENGRQICVRHLESDATGTITNREQWDPNYENVA